MLLKRLLLALVLAALCLPRVYADGPQPRPVGPSIHNYERFEHGGITYIISGGGGAKPYPVLATGDEDLYRGPSLINYNYVLIQIDGKRAEAKMYRVADPAANTLSMEAADLFALEKK